jgi:uncharacterized protein (TIGR02117 family)
VVPFLKFLKNFVFVLVLAIGAYLLAAVVLSLLRTYPQETNCEEQTEIYVSTNGVHIDVILPVDRLEKEFVKQLQLPRGTKYVAFGWGDKNFYINTPQWKDLTVPTALTALFLKSECAMHVTAHTQPWSSWRKMALCPEQVNRLLNYIWNSFNKDSNGKIRQLGIKGYGSNDFFFDARGSFSLFKTCNVWVNVALKKAGVKTSLWSPFAFGILYHFPEDYVDKGGLKG